MEAIGRSIAVSVSNGCGQPPGAHDAPVLPPRKQSAYPGRAFDLCWLGSLSVSTLTADVVVLCLHVCGCACCCRRMFQAFSRVLSAAVADRVRTEVANMVSKRCCSLHSYDGHQGSAAACVRPSLVQDRAESPRLPERLYERYTPRS